MEVVGDVYVIHNKCEPDDFRKNTDKQLRIPSLQLGDTPHSQFVELLEMIPENGLTSLVPQEGLGLSLESIVPSGQSLIAIRPLQENK